MALGRIDGSVVPTASVAGSPSARIAGVDTTAPPTPKAAESTPVPTPASSVSTSRSGPASISGGPRTRMGGIAVAELPRSRPSSSGARGSGRLLQALDDHGHGHATGGAHRLEAVG